jgi:hypothetical protein
MLRDLKHFVYYVALVVGVPTILAWAYFALGGN